LLEGGGPVLLGAEHEPDQVPHRQTLRISPGKCASIARRQVGQLWPPRAAWKSTGYPWAASACASAALHAQFSSSSPQWIVAERAGVGRRGGIGLEAVVRDE